MADKNDAPTATSTAPGKTSKMEAVRQALAALGKKATSGDIESFAKEKFGLDVPPDLGKKYKSEILRKKGKKSGRKKLTKQEAVRRALAELGYTAKPTAIKDHIKERYHLDMGTDHISTAKGDIIRQLGGKDKLPATAPAPVESAPPAKTEAPAPLPAALLALPAAGNGQSSILLDDVLMAKDLVARVGTEQLRQLIDVLAK